MDRAVDYIIILGHGSKVREANEAMDRLAQEVSRKAGLPAICAFLELADPPLGKAVSWAAAKGARRAVVIPCFVAMGAHVRQDLPRLVAEVEESAPGVEIVLGRSLEGHPGLAEILVERVQEAVEAGSRQPVPSARPMER